MEQVKFKVGDIIQWYVYGQPVEDDITVIMCIVKSEAVFINVFNPRDAITHDLRITDSGLGWRIIG